VVEYIIVLGSKELARFYSIMKVFISYSHKDEALARELSATLEKAGLDIWDDRREIMPGENWAEKMAQGLKESDGMVVLLTPDALESNTIRRNIEYALGKEAYSKRLIPVLVGDPQEFPQENLPWIFKHLKMINLPNQGRNEETLRQIAEALKEVA